MSDEMDVDDGEPVLVSPSKRRMQDESEHESTKVVKARVNPSVPASVQDAAADEHKHETAAATATAGCDLTEVDFAVEDALSLPELVAGSDARAPRAGRKFWDGLLPAVYPSATARLSQDALDKHWYRKDGGDPLTVAVNIIEWCREGKKEHAIIEARSRLRA